jgi:catechol 2,3-dioxygenase-like lactoylglutathione lyase family enzyme
MDADLTNLETLSLFVDDLAACRSFYDAVFEPTIVYEDDACFIMQVGGLLVNVLRAGDAAELVEPAPVAASGRGAALLLTLRVDDVDAAAKVVVARGATLLNGPVDRPWGRRTAAFADPAGTVWELAHELPA